MNWLGFNPALRAASAIVSASMLFQRVWNLIRRLSAIGFRPVPGRLPPRI
ncbi:MAG: hypothetical protein P8Z70_07540 [Desulfuromonadales bacterium]